MLTYCTLFAACSESAFSEEFAAGSTRKTDLLAGNMYYKKCDIFQNNIKHTEILTIKGFLNGNVEAITNQQLPVHSVDINKGDYGFIIGEVDL